MNLSPCLALEDDLALRPIHHQLEDRLEAQIFIAFLAYCLQVIPHRRLRDLALGLTPRSVLVKSATIQTLEVYLPTTDGSGSCGTATPIRQRT
jgi:hypothetical protein